MGYSFSAKQPVGWVDAQFTVEGGIFTLHVVEGPTDEDGKPHRLKWRAAKPAGAARPKKKKAVAA